MHDSSSRIRYSNCYVFFLIDCTLFMPCSSWNPEEWRYWRAKFYKNPFWSGTKWKVEEHGLQKTFNWPNKSSNYFWPEHLLSKNNLPVHACFLWPIGKIIATYRLQISWSIKLTFQLKKHKNYLLIQTATSWIYDIPFFHSV